MNPKNIMQRKLKRILIVSLGILFLVLGLVGLVLPFLQGILFLAIGIILVSFSFPKVRTWINKHTEKHPHLASMLNKMERWIKKIVGEY